MSPLCHVLCADFFFLLKEYSKCGGKRVFWQFRNLGLDTWCSACGQVFCKHLQSCFQVQKDLFFVLCPFILILSLHRFNTKLSGGIKFYKKWGFLALWGAYEMGSSVEEAVAQKGKESWAEIWEYFHLTWNQNGWRKLKILLVMQQENLRILTNFGGRWLTEGTLHQWLKIILWLNGCSFHLCCLKLLFKDRFSISGT